MPHLTFITTFILVFIFVEPHAKQENHHSCFCLLEYMNYLQRDIVSYQKNCNSQEMVL